MGVYATCLGQSCMRVLRKMFGLKPALSVVAAVDEPKLSEELVFINFFGF